MHSSNVLLALINTPTIKHIEIDDCGDVGLVVGRVDGSKLTKFFISIKIGMIAIALINYFETMQGK